MNIGQAIIEANRCLLCHDAPCSKSCPGGTDPGKFIRKLRFKNITGAIRTIKENNILGGACGLLCPSARLCEKECSAKGLDRPIRIGAIQSALVEHSWNIGFEVFERPVAIKDKIAIVGSGPAGLSCAATLARAGFKVTMFEEKPQAGGVLRYGVPEYRLPVKFLERELKDLETLGVEIRCSTPIKGKDAIEGLFKNGCKAVFLATGLWQGMRLKEGAIADGVLNATAFLEAMRTKYSAKMKEFIKDKRVAVIGGGSVAIDCAESAAKYGAGDVYLIYRRSFTQMPAEEDERVSALNSGIHFLLLNQPADYIADRSGRLTGVKLIKTRLGPKDASGRKSPENIAGSEWALPVDVCIEAIGSEAPLVSPEWYPMVRVTKGRLIDADTETCKTSAKGIFAGGDVVRGPALVIDAIADGKAAAAAIRESL